MAHPTKNELILLELFPYLNAIMPLVYLSSGATSGATTSQAVATTRKCLPLYILTPSKLLTDPIPE